jgi:transketolase
MRQAFIDTIFELAATDPRVCYIGSDLSPEIMARMKAEMPGRAWMEGVSEQYCVGMATGLAHEGKIPWVHTISTFLTRKGYEQIALAAQQRLPLRLLGNGGGLIYAPLGPTHLAIDDIALMRAIPNMTVICPSDAIEARFLANHYKDHLGPIYFRVGVTQAEINPISMSSRPDVVIASTGSISREASTAAEIIGSSFVHFPVVKPLDSSIIRPGSVVFSVEEHSIIGGLGDAIGADIKIGIPDVWPDLYGTREDLLRHYELTPEQIAERIRREL